jgi:hypothetical protein
VIAAVLACQTVDRVSLFKRTLGINNRSGGSAVVVASRGLVNGHPTVVSESMANAAPADIARSTRPSASGSSLSLYSKLVGIVNAVESRFRHPVIADFVIEQSKV